MIDKELFKRKKLYPFQDKAVNEIIEAVKDTSSSTNILFQLPTGGGKTVIFSNIADRYIKQTGKKVLILTHRIELSVQTSKQLGSLSIPNKVINSTVKNLDDQKQYTCFTAMVETLNNRLQENPDFVENIGLVIVDEAHYNSFRKIFQYYGESNILGVTATPLSSNKTLPLKDNYDKLIVGESISSLIENGYLSDAETFTYDVNLHGLKIGVNGDFTVSSSEVVYGNHFMQEKLIFAYEEVAIETKTLIFNSGIETSVKVAETFTKKGYKIKHLDSTFSDKDRESVIKWFRKTPNAILTSVGILTTGFDEPSVETIILNRATRSLTLYHQMIGRGSRRTQTKSKFTVIDLGNNVKRFGIWQEYINWLDAFEYPDRFLESKLSEEDDINFQVPFEFNRTIQQNYTTDILENFCIKKTYDLCISAGKKGKEAVDLSLNNHLEMIKVNSEDVYDALYIQQNLQDHIKHRLKLYTKCISKSTDNYMKWLLETYNRQLSQKIRSAFD